MREMDKGIYIGFKNQFPLLNRSTGNKLKIAQIRMSFFFAKKMILLFIITRNG